MLALAVSRGNHTNDAAKIDSALRSYAEALRNYETLSLHAESEIPAGSRLIGLLAAMDGLEEVGTEARRPARQKIWKILNKSKVWKFLSQSKIANMFTDYMDQSYLRYTALVTGAIGILLQEKQDGISPSLVLHSMENIVGNLGFRELDQRGRVERSQKQAFTQRVIMALSGGAALIGPMLIMTLHPSKKTSLITVSVATSIFALVFALVARDSAGKDVLGITAAYAAVLVVFVGTSTAPAS